MNKDSIFLRVSQVIGDKKEPGTRVRMESHLKDDLGMDSMDVYDMCVDLEEAFNIVIDDQAIVRMKIVQDVVNEIEKIVTPN